MNMGLPKYFGLFMDNRNVKKKEDKLSLRKNVYVAIKLKRNETRKAKIN